MIKKEPLTCEEKQKIKNRVIHSMSCENMKPTANDLNNIDKILNNEISADELIQLETEKMKQEGLID